MCLSIPADCPISPASAGCLTPHCPEKSHFRLSSPNVIKLPYIRFFLYLFSHSHLALFASDVTLSIPLELVFRNRRHFTQSLFFIIK
jgi:hypothetical protein